MNITQTQLQNIIQEEDTYKEKLIELVLRRNQNHFNLELYNAYERAGIIYHKDWREFNDFHEYLLGEELPYDYFKRFTLSEGYFIPCFNHVGQVLYYINYSFTRDVSQKYLIAYPQPIKDTLGKIKVYGLEDHYDGLKTNRLYVTEGTFDRLRLKAEQLPVMSGMGTEVTQYFRDVLARFKEVVYIGDNDTEGKKAFQKMRRRGVTMLWQGVPRYKDVDEFASKEPESYKEWIQQLIQG